MSTWPNKDPDEVLDYQIDWADRLATSELVSASTLEVVQGTVVIDSEGYTPQGVVTAWLSGGVAGELCLITNHITTTLGREYELTAKLRIRTK